jgi:tRNA dimethylallyltransferase
MMKSGYNLVTVLGPTAGNKTAFAARLACETEGEIISADSRQVYRRMNLGTGKDYDDYYVNGIAIPYHLVDIVEPGYKYNVFEFQRDFLSAYREITARGHFPVLIGGTGLYIDAALKGYRLLPVPENKPLRKELSDKPLEELVAMLVTLKKLHNKTDADTRERAVRGIEIALFNREHMDEIRDFPSIHNLCLGIKFDRAAERQRITQRLHERLAQGMVDEVKALLDHGLRAEDIAYYGLEYKFITLYLTGNLGYDNMVAQLNTAIHQFAKRQMTWFRKMEREGTTIHWIEGELPMEEKLQMALRLLGGSS